MNDATNYEEFKKAKIKNVGELITVLQQYASDTEIQINDNDIGGYDCITKNYCVVNYDKEKNNIQIGHLEFELYMAERNQIITHEQFNELNEE